MVPIYFLHLCAANQVQASTRAGRGDIGEPPKLERLAVGLELAHPALERVGRALALGAIRAARKHDAALAGSGRDRRPVSSGRSPRRGLRCRSGRMTTSNSSPLARWMVMTCTRASSLPTGEAMTPAHGRLDRRSLRTAARFELEPVERAEQQFRIREIRCIVDRRGTVERKPGRLQPARRANGLRVLRSPNSSTAPMRARATCRIRRRPPASRMRSRIDSLVAARERSRSASGKPHQGARGSRARPSDRRRAASREQRDQVADGRPVEQRFEFDAAISIPASRRAARIGGSDGARAPGWRRSAGRFCDGIPRDAATSAAIARSSASSSACTWTPSPAPRFHRGRRRVAHGAALEVVDGGNRVAKVALTQSTMAALERKLRPRRSATSATPPMPWRCASRNSVTSASRNA